MGWHISLIENTVVVPPACAEDLLRLDVFEGWARTVDDLRTEAGHLVFFHDWMEHMDYIGDPEVLGALLRHNARGDICFGSLDGDNAGRFWGYRFTDEGVTGLNGVVVWNVPEKMSKAVESLSVPSFAVVRASKPEDVPEWLPTKQSEDLTRTLAQWQQRDTYRSFLIIKVGDKVVIESDGGEAEDNTFDRDWSWIEDVIAEAYQQGRRDGGSAE